MNTLRMPQNLQDLGIKESSKVRGEEREAGSRSSKKDGKEITRWEEATACV